MNEEDRKIYEASIKSKDTEEFLDLWFYRPQACQKVQIRKKAKPTRSVLL